MKPTSIHRISILPTAPTGLFLILLCILGAAVTINDQRSTSPQIGVNRSICSPIRLLSKDIPAAYLPERQESGEFTQSGSSNNVASLLANGINSKESLTPGLANFIPDTGNFDLFIQKVSDGQPGVPRGVYVPDILALPIIQQPASNPLYVSNKFGLATQYSRAAKYGVTGILAHNYLSGETFDQLTLGQPVVIVYGDRATRFFQVREIHRFQKLAGSDRQSDYLDLSSGVLLTADQVFNQFYRGSEHVTFQTCLKSEGIWNWGLVFVIAVPIDGLH
jgi:hypothetical protein